MIKSKERSTVWFPLRSILFLFLKKMSSKLMQCVKCEMYENRSICEFIGSLFSYILSKKFDWKYLDEIMLESLVLINLFRYWMYPSFCSIGQKLSCDLIFSILFLFSPPRLQLAQHGGVGGLCAFLRGDGGSLLPLHGWSRAGG